MNRSGLLLVALALAAVVLFPTAGAPFSDTPDETDDIVMTPIEGPNGVYAVPDLNGQLTIDLSEEHQELAGDGVNDEGVTEIPNIFAITNEGEQPVSVYIETDIDTTDVEFREGTDLGRSIQGEENAARLEPSASIAIGLIVDTRGDDVVERLSEFTVHADQIGEDEDVAPPTDPDPPGEDPPQSPPDEPGEDQPDDGPDDDRPEDSPGDDQPGDSPDDEQPADEPGDEPHEDGPGDSPPGEDPGDDPADDPPGTGDGPGEETPGEEQSGETTVDQPGDGPTDDGTADSDDTTEETETTAAVPTEQLPFAAPDISLGGLLGQTILTLIVFIVVGVTVFGGSGYALRRL